MYKLTKYYNCNSEIHDMNALYKLICELLFIFLTLINNDILLFLLMTLFEMALISLSKVPLNLYLNNIKFSIPLIVFIVTINLIFNEPIITTFTSIIKLILIILYSSLLLYTTKANDVTDALEILFSPLKIFNIPVSNLVLTISLSLRFIPIILKETDRIVKSEISRGLNFDGNLKDKCDKLISVIIPIFKSAFKRADNISDVLELKLYNCKTDSNKYKNIIPKEIDYSILFMHLLIFFIFVVVEVLL